MLETLTIKNVAIIDFAEIPFRSGLNILSGETGAGKSIVIEAISLILGSRADVNLIRSGCDEAVVEGLFNVGQIPWIQARLERLGFTADSSELLVKRIINRAGKHRIYVNGELATLAILHDLCEGLVDLCGQNEHQSLLKPTTQLELLDRYGGLSENCKVFSQNFSRYRSLSRESEALEQAEADRSKRSDYLAFQIHELQEAGLTPDEDEALSREKSLLQSSEARLSIVHSISSSLDNEEAGLTNSLRGAVQKARALTQQDPSAADILAPLERALAELEDSSMALDRYSRGVDLDPERLNWVQERLSLIADLRRKYGATVNDMLAALTRLEGEASSMGEASLRLKGVIEELERARGELRAAAKKLSSSRKKSADLFSKSVTDELRDLKMAEAKFMIELTPLQEISSWSPTGMDAIQFVVETNRGESARPLGKIASGGELSRLMLAIRRVISDRGGIGVYLFDEIDAGIGGQTAFQVGKKLKSVASFNQVICITHLPQVASFADHHLSVQKSARKDRTMTEVIVLSARERKEELARMLGGPELTKKSLDNAAELLEMAR